MNNIIVTTPEQLNEIIRQTIQTELSNYRIPANDRRLVEEPDEYITFKEALLFLKISRPTLYKRMQDNTIPYQKVGTRLLFSKRKIIMELEKKANATQKKFTN